MNASALIPLSFIALFAVNAMHWHGRTDERFTYFPGAGILKALLLLLNIASIVLAILFFAGIVAGVYVMAACFAAGALLQVYSIWFRKRARKR